MSTQEPSKESTPNSFVCDCEEDMRYACASEGFYKKKEGKRYCVLHYPGGEKVEAFRTALNNKLASKDYNFNGVWFPKGVSFKELHLDGSANFISASFNEDIDFSGVEFKIRALFKNASFNAGVNFSRVIFFAGADFRSASFSKDTDFASASFRAEANFGAAIFSGNAGFSSAIFGGNADFGSSIFSGNADFRDANFNGNANFSSANFSMDAGFIFSIFSADAFFHSASFSGNAGFGSASFNKDASFSSASFNKDADFSSASFSAVADFSSASFNKDASFSRVSFNKDASFSSASFSADAYFIYASFSAFADFSYATFKDYFYFDGGPKKRTFGDQQLNFQFTHFEKPDRVSFHTLDLKPHWFVNVDSRKFVFIHVEFSFDLNEELKNLNNANVSAPHRLLAIACRQLAVNAEENHRYRQAANLRYASMDAQRLEWLQDRKIKEFQFLHWLYWIASGYGERINRAVVALVMLWLLFALSYKVVGFEHKTSKPSGNQSAISAQEDEVGKPLPFKKVFTYSLGVMSLQKPDPKPVTIAAQTLVIFETILCPIQAALLALAIRRKFMR